MKYKNIVISGDVGTGTSTLAKGLATKLGWEHLSAGDIFRPYFKEKNIPLWNKSKIPDSFDKEIDNGFLEKMKTSNDIVFDSHYGGWFARDLDRVFKILLTTDKEVATKRIIDRQHTHKETSKEIEMRRKQLGNKFKKIYSSDNYEEPKYFHLVIDTTHIGVEETINKSLRAFNSE